MLFTGAALSAADRVRIADGGVVHHREAGFAYTSTNQLVTDSSNAAQSWIKGVGIRNTGAVCTTTTTGGTDTWSEGVRITAAGKLVIADAAPQSTTNGNPVRTTGALATTIV
jgi:hypothetical protein